MAVVEESIRTWQVSRVIISMNYASIAHTVLALFHHFPLFISVSKLAQRRTTKTTTTKPTNSGQAADSDWNCVRGEREKRWLQTGEGAPDDDDEQPYGQSRMWCAVWGERAKRWLYVLPSSMCSHVIAVKSTATTTTIIIIIPDNLSSTITARKSRSRGEKETGRSVARTSASFYPLLFNKWVVVMMKWGLWLKQPTASRQNASLCVLCCRGDFLILCCF